AGDDYGMGSSRDWAAKGTNLLGVKAVIAASYERIHRSNLVMMGVLPLQFVDGEDADALGLDGSETFDIQVDESVKPGDLLDVVATNDKGEKKEFKVKARFDSEVEVDYYRHGGILQLVLRNKLKYERLYKNSPSLMRWAVRFNHFSIICKCYFFLIVNINCKL